MRRQLITLISYTMLAVLLCLHPLQVNAAPEIDAPSYLLMEASTGKIIYEHNAGERRSPASITKIMTLLLIFDYLDSGRIHLQSDVITSEHAKSMGGSQVFLEEGEVQSLETIIKCIAVASGNDASVAAAEFIAGSEPEFVNMMNAKAKELGLQDTHFEDCCGLSESDDHYTSARDVAVMSRELICRHPEILDYTKIWMEDITHETAQGTSTFTLSSTNKLLKMYEWTTGLKTGSTSKAKYCLSATASKDHIELIAVIMGSSSNKVRFRDAMALLNYGYSICALFEDSNTDQLPMLPVKGGMEDQVALKYEGAFRYIDIEGNALDQIQSGVVLPPDIEAPIQENTAVGEKVYTMNGKRIGSVSILAAGSIEKAGYKDYLLKMLRMFYNIT